MAVVKGGVLDIIIRLFSKSMILNPNTPILFPLQKQIICYLPWRRA
jgi:hypothetical protein